MLKNLFSPSIRRPRFTFWLSWGLLWLLLALPTMWFQVGEEGGFSVVWALLLFPLVDGRFGKNATGRWGIQLIYLLLLCWQCYRLFSWRLYLVEPNFLHDWSLLTEVLPIFWSELSLGKFTAYLPLLLGAIVGIGVLIWLLRLMVRASVLMQADLQRGDQLATRGLVLFSALAVFTPWAQLSPLQIAKSLRASLQLKEDITQIYPPPIAEKWPDSLRYQPDVYLIFLESYGSVLATEPAYQERYQTLMQVMEANLGAQNWQMGSRWSQAPISGGRSWLSFSSVITGKKLYAHPQYTTLLAEAPDYPHMVRFFNEQGYYTLRMNTLAARSQSARIPYELYDRFFAFDQWLREPDFPYQGPAYGKFGSLPDQYALGYAVDSVVQDRSPFFLFFITLNSHSPWNDVPVLTDHWTELEQLPDTAALGRENSVMEGLATEKYWKAMEYQLQMMEQLVLQQGDSNSLFIFLGDHQPPFITEKGASFQTPVHFLSQNPDLANRFRSRGFLGGLTLDPKEVPHAQLQHHDLYPLLVNLLR